MQSIDTDYIIVGQGIAGTMMAHHLMQANKRVHIIDDGHHTSSSMAAAGIINPITGRKYVKSWRAEDFIPYARKVYTDITALLETTVARDTYIYRALYDAEDENNFLSRATDEKARRFICTEPHEVAYEGLVSGVLSYGVVQDAMQVNLPELLSRYRAFLLEQSCLTEEVFDYSQIHINQDSVKYKNISALGIIFAEGFRGRSNPFFKNDIRYEPVKGEALIVEFPQHSFENILRHKIFIAPIGNSKYWVGAGYEWDFEDHKPSSKEYATLKDKLDAFIQIPYRIVDHVAGIRPSVKERKPRLGQHPQYPRMYCFNGMGTKGSSLAPYWANALTEHIVHNISIDPEVHIYG